MNPTTQAYIDPSDVRLAGALGPDGVPVLVAVPTTNSTTTAQSQNPFTNQNSASAYNDISSLSDTSSFNKSSSFNNTSSFNEPSSLRGTSNSSSLQGTSNTSSLHNTTNPSPLHSSSTPSSLQNASSTSKTTSNTTSANSSSTPVTTGLRQRVNSLSAQLDNAAQHPAVQNAKGTAQNQVQQVRQQLGRSPMVVDLEKRTGVDRVFLLAGGILAYLILIPLNLFGLAFPTTNLLTFVPPFLLAINVLDKKDKDASVHEESTKALLAYFVTFGFVQFAESLLGGVLARRIPQYFTVKLLFLAYLIHPKTKGALKIHDSVFRPLLAKARSAQSFNPNTPPTSNPAASTVTSPTAGVSHSSSGFASANRGDQTSGFASANRGDQTSSEFASGFASGYATGNVGTAGGATIHLPSGGGSGVGLDVRDDGLHKPAY